MNTSALACRAVAAWRALVRLPSRVLLLLLCGYRLFLSPWLGSACRFHPTCSVYAQQAIGQHGALAGSALTAWRLLRCHPWCEGGCDPVPPRLGGLFTALGLGAPTGPGRGPVAGDAAAPSPPPSHPVPRAGAASGADPAAGPASAPAERLH